MQGSLLLMFRFQPLFFFTFSKSMEIPTELQQSITKATQAVEKAQSDYDNMLAKVSNLETAYANDFTIKNQTASLFDIDQYLKTALKFDYENLARKEENLAREKDGKQNF